MRPEGARNASPPARRRGLKPAVGNALLRSAPSPPARRRGLKPSISVPCHTFDVSPPARRRGLKLGRRIQLLHDLAVASRAEAWIETGAREPEIAWTSRSPPARRRGLKLPGRPVPLHPLAESPPARRRGLKHQGRDAQRRRRPSPP